MHRSSRVVSSLLLAKRARLRWRPAAWVFGASFSLVVAFALLLPDTYRSHMDIVVGSVGTDPRLPEVTHGSPKPSRIGDPRINSEIQRLTSEDLLRSVVVQSHLASSSGVSDAAKRKREDAAVSRLQADLAVTAFRGPDIVEISYQSSSPERASEVLRTIAGAYANTHRIFPVAPTAAAHLQIMAASNRDHLSAARTELAHFVKAHRIPQAPVTLEQAEVQLTEAEDATQRALLRRVIDLQKLDRSFRARIDEARLVERLDAQTVGNLGSMEPSPPLLASAPPRTFLVFCGFLASLLLAAGSALALELLSDRLDTKSSVEQATGIPVLASIPANAVAPSFQDAFPALYLAMQRPVDTFEGKLS